MPPPYQSRSDGNPRARTQSMAELKLRRLQELIIRLREDLDRPRVKVSEAATSLVNYCTNTRDFMVPSVWGQMERNNNPYNPEAGKSGGCCAVM